MKYLIIIFILPLMISLGCQKTTIESTPEVTNEVKPMDINIDGFDLLEKMQGHWVGSNLVMTNDFEWFGWDFRAISSSHIHGIFHGGTMGDLFVSFFVTDYKNTRTIMARNGGVMNGIYRTSYFVLDKVEDKGREGKYYRFVDAVGGKKTMSFEIRIQNDNIFWNVYTSSLGNREPTRHMSFVAKKMHIELADKAQKETGFPKNVVENGLDFSNGFDTKFLYAEEDTKPKSATFLARGEDNNVYALAPQSGDPYTIVDHPRLGSLKVDLVRNSEIKDHKLLVYLSQERLTDMNGQMTDNLEAYNTILQFPEVYKGQSEYLFTYLHPGDYYLTVFADKNNDGIPSQGDIVSISKSISIAPLEQKETIVSNINIQN